MATKLGFIGLGLMGLPMAGRLLDAGYALFVHTRTASKSSKLTTRGAKLVRTPAELAAKCDIIFMCVTDTPDVVAIVRGEKDDRHGWLTPVPVGSKQPVGV